MLMSAISITTMISTEASRGTSSRRRFSMKKRNEQAERHDEREQDDSGQNLRLPERQRDQHGHERTESSNADDIPQHHDYQGAKGNHQQHRVNRLGLDRQREQRKIRNPGLDGLGPALSNQYRVGLIALDRERDFRSGGRRPGRTAVPRPATRSGNYPAGPGRHWPDRNTASGRHRALPARAARSPVARDPQGSRPE